MAILQCARNTGIENTHKGFHRLRSLYIQAPHIASNITKEPSSKLVRNNSSSMSSSSSMMAGAKKTWKWNKDSADIAVNESEMTGGYYDEILTQLRARLASDYIRSRTHHRPILPTFGTTTAKTKWFDLRMHVDAKTTVDLKLRREDIYLKGYRVNSQQWRELKGDDDKYTHEIDKHSQLLGYNGSYGALRGYATQETVGSGPLVKAATNLATKPYDAPEIANALFVIIVMFCEASRFVPVQLFVQRNFHESTAISDWVGDLVHRWGKLCGHVLYFHLNPKEKWVNQTLRIDVNGHVKDVVVRTIDDMLEYLGILQKNPAKIQPAPEN